MAKVILAIDDDKDFLSTLKEVLEIEGYKVITLQDPHKTEEYIKDNNPDLLIMDILMPGRSGFNLVEDLMIKEEYQALPKVFVTCVDEEAERTIASACGVKGYIVKPFKPEELLSSIKSILEKSKE